MGFGRYRFRRSFGNVSSQFRGARFDTYPLFTGILDDYPSAAAAYSLRALSEAWLAGDVVEVRRSSDSSTQSFTAKQVADGTLTAFCGAGDGFVSTWYDQSGNGNDATQINTARQRQIVSSGSLVLLNEQPALSGAFEYNTSAIALSGDFSIISLGAWNVLDSLLGDQSSSSPRIRTTSGGFQLNIVNNANTAANINIPTQSGSQSMIGIYRNTANLINVPVNTNDPTEGNSATLSGDFTFNRILSRNSGIDPFDGAFQELIIWNRDIR